MVEILGSIHHQHLSQKVAVPGLRLLTTQPLLIQRDLLVVQEAVEPNMLLEELEGHLLNPFQHMEQRHMEIQEDPLQRQITFRVEAAAAPVALE
jgi:hypothetical protein